MAASCMHARGEQNGSLELFAAHLAEIESQAAVLNRSKADLYRQIRDAGFRPEAARSLASGRADAAAPSRSDERRDRRFKRLPRSAFAAPRMATVGELRAAARAGSPISQDFKYWDARVYIAVRLDYAEFKVGLSNRVPERVAELEQQIGMGLLLVGSFPGCRQTELVLLEALAPWRLHGEWFALNDQSRAAAVLAVAAAPEAAGLVLPVASMGVPTFAPAKGSAE